MWFVPTGFDKPIRRFPWATYLLLIIVGSVNLVNLSGDSSADQLGMKSPWRVRGDEWNWETIVRSSLTPELPMLTVFGLLFALFWVGRPLEGTAGSVRYVLALVGATLFGTCTQMWATAKQPTAPYESTGFGLVTALIGMSLWMAPHFRLRFISQQFGEFTVKMWHLGIFVLVACVLITFPPMSQNSGRYYLIPALAMGLMLPIVMGVPATGKADSARMTKVAQTGTHLSLPLNELKANYENDRHNLDALFYYVCKCGSEGFQAEKRAQVQFWKHFDHFRAHKKIQELAAGVAGFYRGENERPVHQMVKFADEVEEADMHDLAVRIFEKTLNDRRMKDQDREYALFRLGHISQVWLEDAERARGYYEEILRRFPFSHKISRVHEAMSRLPKPGADTPGTIPANLDS